MIFIVPEWWEFTNDPAGQFSGYVSTLPTREERDVVAELREVVEEVTGKPVDQEPKRRIGFVQ